MSDHFISRSGTQHILECSGSKLHGGRIVALCGFSQSPDEEPPGNAIQICSSCLEAEEKARQIVRNSLEAAGERRQDPEATQ